MIVAYHESLLPGTQTHVTLLLFTPQHLLFLHNSFLFKSLFFLDLLLLCLLHQLFSVAFELEEVHGQANAHADAEGGDEQFKSHDSHDNPWSEVDPHVPLGVGHVSHLLHELLVLNLVLRELLVLQETFLDFVKHLRVFNLSHERFGLLVSVELALLELAISVFAHLVD